MNVRQRSRSRQHAPSRACRQFAASWAALLLATACTSPPEILRVSERLDSSAFDEPMDGLHAPMATIGNTSRPVVAAPQREIAWQAFGLPAPGGTAPATLALPKNLATLEEANFSLDMQAFPGMAGADESIFRSLAETNFWNQVEGGWELEGAGRERTLALEHSSLSPKNSAANLRLIATARPPSDLNSRPFQLRKGATLRLHFGPAPGQAESISFLASLQCADEKIQTIADTSLREPAGADRRWTEVRWTTRQDRRDCRLALRSQSAPGAVGGGLWAWPEILERESSASAPPNVILLGLDTLRADHLSGYGYPRPTSPAIDERLIERGTLFENVSTTFPQTDVSHLSLFTGLYPAAQPQRGRLAPGTMVTTLAESLQAAGFATAAITENALVSGAFGFWFGFDLFRERSVADEKLGPTTFADARAFIEQNREEQFFLFLHTYQTHTPYDSSTPYASLFEDDGYWDDGGRPPYVPEKRRHRVDAYDRTIRETDDLVNDLLDTIEANGLAERTLVVLFSDHGEAFGEHGFLEHGMAGHEEQLRVPLVLRGPGIPAGKRIEGPASLTDVAPTLLSILGLPALPQGQGIDLSGALNGAPLDAGRAVFFSWIGADAAGARTATWKVTRTRDESRDYDMKADPFEWHTRRGDRLPTQRAAVLDEHARASARLRDQLADQDETDTGASIPERTKGALRALGYLE